MVSDVQEQQVPENPAPEVNVLPSAKASVNGFEHELIIANCYTHKLKDSVVALKVELVFTADKFPSESDMYQIIEKLMVEAQKVAANGGA